MPNWTHFALMLGRGKEEEENTKRWRKRMGQKEEGTGGLGINR